MRALNDQIKAYLDQFSEHLDQPIVNIEEIETERRDGYSPHSWNKGGYQLKAFTDLMHYWGSGEHHNTYAASFIEYLVDRDRKHHMECNELTEADMEPESEHDQSWIEGLSDDSNSLYFELMIMLTSETTCDVNLYFEGSDAPYHRGCDFKLELELEFTSPEDLKKQLEALTPRFEQFFLVASSDAGAFEAVESRSIYMSKIRKDMSEIA